VLDPAALRARLDSVRDRIARAAGRVQRDPASVHLIAVSKTFSHDFVRAAADAGHLDFGENKVQEALAKITATADLQLRWHLVGHLQSNKARKAAEHFHAIHSVDTLSLLSTLDQAAHAAGHQVDLLIQVDLGREPTKHGAPPDLVAPVFLAAAKCRAVRVTGLMTLPPASVNPDGARPYFSALRALRDRLGAEGVDPAMLKELSMGMSHDFEVAIEEGATLVRVGSAIFGQRDHL
jgi:pyridoxal phosphate enzyme (YggS family)